MGNIALVYAFVRQERERGPNGVFDCGCSSSSIT